ncbi:pirin family protein [Chitinasiproducens palmae]|uniref:Pirin family protein n=1 Tax=Chitinasiproducens palmae TaxID=1770053 RepID=A0A1H2PL97_9BURK|nr:pirin family protein [Chitinasiproducens palmae]SDV46416.1 hypothetical protein SAMN05216551_101321 [Chitinasiproducens palmae]
MTYRSVKAVHRAQRDDIGSLRTRRALPGPGLRQLDPFLFLNHHGPQHYPPANEGLPFGPHPHRGFETVTFILSGMLAHRDSAGHESVIGQGGVQWMTAGAGLVHAELSPAAFIEQGGDLEILQLWVNLPARLKRVAPRYVGLQGDAIPTVRPAQGVAIEAVSGDWFGQTGPFSSSTDVRLGLVRFDAGATLDVTLPPDYTVLCHVIDGVIEADGSRAGPADMIEFHFGAPRLRLRAAERARVLLGTAQPLGEPVVSYGPFVMNTREEIEEALADYRAGRFDTPLPG